MKVSELITILSKLDPEAVVFTEYDGAMGPIEIDDISVGRAQLVRLIETSPHYRLEPYDVWRGACESEARVVRECQGVSLGGGGGSDADDWMSFVDFEMIKETK